MEQWKNDLLGIYRNEIKSITDDGLLKNETPLCSPQGRQISLEDGRKVINMCANNYLGLADDPRVIEAAKQAYDERGYGLSSVPGALHAKYADYDTAAFLHKKTSSDRASYSAVRGSTSRGTYASSISGKSVPRDPEFIEDIDETK